MTLRSLTQDSPDSGFCLRTACGHRAYLRNLVCLALILSSCSTFATDINREPWHWSGDMPADIKPATVPATGRELRAFKHLHIGVRTTMKDLVRKIGMPDAFAPQYFFSRSHGVPVKPGDSAPDAGTFHYLLRDGAEIFVTVSSDNTIAVIWYCAGSDKTVDLISAGQPLCAETLMEWVLVHLEGWVY